MSAALRTRKPISMAQVQLLLAACVLALPLCSALKCFECTECEAVEIGVPKKCKLGNDVCMTVSLGEAKMKSCASSTFCREGDVEMDFTNVAKNTLVNWFEKVLDNSEDGAIPERRLVKCCQTDYCNTASMLTPATALLLLVPLLVGTFYG